MVFQARCAVERFFEKVNQDGPNGCWEWIGGVRRPLPYGMFWPTKATPMSAHRYSYALHHGDLPADLMVCHTCDNPRCVNPDHLWLGTGRDNQADRKRKGRGLEGERNGRAKLDRAKVAAIRADPRPHNVVAGDYGVTPESVSNARRGITWT